MALIIVRATYTNEAQTEVGYLKFDSSKPLHIMLRNFLFKIPAGHYDFAFSTNKYMTEGSCTRFSTDLKEDQVAQISISERYGEPSFEVLTPEPEFLEELYGFNDAIKENIYEDFGKARNSVISVLEEHPEWPQSYKNQVISDLDAKLSTIDKRCEFACPIINDWIQSYGKRDSSNDSYSKSDSSNVSPHSKVAKVAKVVVAVIWALFFTAWMYILISGR